MSNSEVESARNLAALTVDLVLAHLERDAVTAHSAALAADLLEPLLGLALAIDQKFGVYSEADPTLIRESLVAVGNLDIEVEWMVSAALDGFNTIGEDDEITTDDCNHIIAARIAASITPYPQIMEWLRAIAELEEGH